MFQLLFFIPPECSSRPTVKLESSAPLVLKFMERVRQLPTCVQWAFLNKSRALIADVRTSFQICFAWPPLDHVQSCKFSVSLRLIQIHRRL
ncbi:hypothetical protein TNIN_435171 [Trichonephila inaurata madagascariensis]|uniref:Uncharacterized protein n=1 Tax=Trichonephila inaurata madagascariensis TaxID=2747483 RepID=A0A8X6YLW4_9ARAC|nr:hypothetical protein TNIN_435171 [Trichonephila inaurata madagascariensis]